MKIKNFVYSVVLFLLLIVSQVNAFDYALKYPKGKHVNNPANISYENIDVGVEQFRQNAKNHMQEQNVKVLHETLSTSIPNGTCYGQSFTFMLLNPPSSKKLQMPKKDSAQLQVIWFQGQNVTTVSFNKKFTALLEKGLSILRKANPGQVINEKMDLVEINEALSKVPPDIALLHDQIEFQHMLIDTADLTTFLKVRLEEEKSKLSAKGYTALPAKLLKKSDFKKSDFKKNDFQKKVQEALGALTKNSAVSDIVVSFDLDFDGTQSAHAILVQLKHGRVYDANSGIYHYKSKKDMIKDLVMTRQKGCKEVGLRPYSFQKKKAK